MTADTQLPVEFKSAGFRNIAWSTRIGLILSMAVFGAAIPLLLDLVGPRSPDNPPPALYALCGALFGVTFLLVIRANHRGWRYMLGETALEFQGPGNTISIAYSSIQELLVDNSRVRGRGIYVKTSQALHSAFPESPDDFAALLSSRTGIPLKPYTWRLSWDAGLVAMVSVSTALAIAMLRTKGSPSLLAGLAVMVTGPAFVLMTLRLSRRQGGTSSWVIRVVMWFAAAGFALQGAREIADWNNSAVAAADKASIARPLDQPLMVTDLPGVSFTIPAGWRFGRSSADGVRWLVLSGPRTSGDILLYVSVPAERLVRAPALKGANPLYPSAIASAIDKAATDYKGPRVTRTGTFKRSAAQGVWGLVYTESIITPDSLSLTLFRLTDKAAIGVTIERGSAGDSAVAAFLDSVKVDGVEAPYPEFPRPLVWEEVVGDTLG